MTGHAERILWLAAATMLVAAAVRWRTVEPPPSSADAMFLVLPATAPLISPDSVATAARVLIAGDPFRIDRRPAKVRFRPDAERTDTSPRTARPALRLTGILGGSPWQAVLEGLPGRAGSVVVHEGELVEGFLVGSVRYDTVVVHGADTTWVLTVTQPWH